MGAIRSGDVKLKLMCGDVKIKRAYAGDVKVYSAGSIVTYKVGVDTYQEEIDEGASCLSPKTFTPALSGWNFVGWRQDAAASGSVLSSLVMGDAPVTLYAVFRQTVTLSYSGNGATSGSTAAQTGYRYYNSGNVANPAFTLRANGFTRTSYTFTKWALGSAGGTQYAAGASVTLAASTTVYAVWIATNLIVTGNANYITVSGTQGAEFWYTNGEVDNTAYINVNYAGYRSIKITLEVHVQKPDDYTWMIINGVEVYNKRTGVNKLTQHEVINGAAENIKYRWAGTFTGTKIPVRCFTQNYSSGSTWTSIRWSIVSAELSM